MRIAFELQGNRLEYENDAVTDALEMGFAFGDGEEGHEYCYAHTWQAFIGRAFHLMQQTGGTLSVNGYAIKAAKFSDTAGKPVTQNTHVILANGETVPLSKILTPT